MMRRRKRRMHKTDRDKPHKAWSMMTKKMKKKNWIKRLQVQKMIDPEAARMMSLAEMTLNLVNSKARVRRLKHLKEPWVIPRCLTLQSLVVKLQILLPNKLVYPIIIMHRFFKTKILLEAIQQIRKLIKQESSS